MLGPEVSAVWMVRVGRVCAVLLVAAVLFAALAVLV